MPTSELTDALNPFIGQQGQPLYSSDDQRPYPSQSFHTPPPQSSFIPHRSELEYAISEPPPPPRYHLAVTLSWLTSFLQCRPRVDAAHVVQELFRALSTTREAQESENKRRAAWEQELEVKYQQRQAETESQLAEMKRQITYLKACVASLLHQRHEAPAHLASGSGYLLDEPGSPSPAAPPGAGLEKPPPFVSHGHMISGQSQRHGMLVDAVSPSASPVPSNRKRPTPPLDHRECDSGDSGSDVSVSSAGKRPQKRMNNHDKTCYTIQVFYITDPEMIAEQFHRLQCADTSTVS